MAQDKATLQAILQQLAQEAAGLQGGIGEVEQEVRRLEGQLTQAREKILRNQGAWAYNARLAEDLKRRLVEMEAPAGSA